MIELQLTPHFKYSMIICCQIRKVFSIYIPTRARLVHKNDQHVQGWDPTTNFSVIAKIQKQENGNQKIDKLILMYVDNNFLWDHYSHKDIHLFSPKIESSKDK